MRSYVPDLTAVELIYLLREEITTAYGAPSLYITAEKEYIIEENFDRRLYELEEDGANFDLVNSIARLTVEPWVESGYWILEITIERALGPIRMSQEDHLTRRDLTLDEFEDELCAFGQKQVSVRVFVQRPDVKQDFDDWLAEMRKIHPPNTELRIQR